MPSTLSKHTYTQRDPPRNSTLLTNKHSQLSITLCQPKPVLFPGSTGLQCPHCECATATACCWITVKYYPDDIDIVGYASLFLFQVRLPPSQFGEQSFPADCWSPTDLRTPQDSCPIAAGNIRHNQFVVCQFELTIKRDISADTFWSSDRDKGINLARSTSAKFETEFK